MEIKITSSAFEYGDMIPAKYTCDGADISPPLEWDNIPQATANIAIISDDPDAPMGTWVHWVLYDLPPQTRNLQENFPKDETLPDGTRQGISDFGNTEPGGFQLCHEIFPRCPMAFSTPVPGIVGACILP